MLKFSIGNHKMKILARKLGVAQNKVVAFDIPAGYTCPKASICKSFANRATGKLRRVGRVLCYAARSENYMPNVRNFRWNNFEALMKVGRDVQKLYNLIVKSLPKNNVLVVRIHAAGDFFWREYFLAWVEVARHFPNITFFAYTKILDYALYPHGLPNLFIQYSYGSQDDIRWSELEVKPPTCFIGERPQQYPDISVVCGSDETDHEDFFSIITRKSFVIDVH